MPVEIVLDLRDLRCFKETLGKESLGAAAIARVETLHENGKVMMICDEGEALDLLASSRAAMKVRLAKRFANCGR